MIQQKSVLGIIPARGGSKGVPRKNIRSICGKPLIEYTVIQARKSKYIDELVVSTEDDEIKNVSSKLGVTIVERPPEMALDDTPGITPILHVLSLYKKYDLVIVLQPTSPLRLTEDIDGALEFKEHINAPACVSISQSSVNPCNVFILGNDKNLTRLIEMEPPLRRQDLPEYFVLNGAIYIADNSWLLKKQKFLTTETRAFLMPESRSLDIDTEDDIQYFEYLCNKHTNPDIAR